VLERRRVVDKQALETGDEQPLANLDGLRRNIAEIRG
jgi:hypothetical protein